MEVFRVTGPTRLSGEVAITGAKNSVLKLMAASLMAEGSFRLTNVPGILDVHVMGRVLERLGCGVEHLEHGVRIDVPGDVSSEATYDLVRRMRATIAVLGPLLARNGWVKVALPGGDAIGSRGLDMHINGLERMGAEFSIEHGYLEAKAPRLTGANVWFDFPSVGATENILMAATLAEGTTVIDNAAREPEIADLCTMLVKMGADIEGAGTSTLTIHGVERLRPVEHRTVPDRIVAGTFAIAAVMTRGDVVVHDCVPGHLEVLLDKLDQAGAHISVSPEGTSLHVVMDRRPRAVDVVTLPYPGFATDLQPQMISMLAVSDGAAMVTENVFEARFMFVNELARLGAQVRLDGHHCVVRGIDSLSGAPVRATDVRAGVGLVMAGLVADGATEVSEVYHIDRGYDRLIDLLGSLGAHIERVEVPDEEPLDF